MTRKIRYYLGSLYDRQGHMDRGRADGSDSPDQSRKCRCSELYRIHLDSERIRLDDAERLLRKALALKPDNGYIQDSWGWYLFVRGRLKEAVVQLEKAAKMKPERTDDPGASRRCLSESELAGESFDSYRDAFKYAEDDEAKRKIQIKAESLRRELVEGRPMSPGAQERLPASAIPTIVCVLTITYEIRWV